MTERFELTAQDLFSPTWIGLKKHLEDQIVLLRSENDRSLDEIATANLRGQIKFAKRILALESNSSTPSDQQG